MHTFEAVVFVTPLLLTEKNAKWVSPVDHCCPSLVQTENICPSTPTTPEHSKKPQMELRNSHRWLGERSQGITFNCACPLGSGTPNT